MATPHITRPSPHHRNVPHNTARSRHMHTVDRDINMHGTSEGHEEGKRWGLEEGVGGE